MAVQAETRVTACEDFFEYTNGEWLRTTEIPADEPSWGSFAQVRDWNRDVLHGILDEASASSAPDGTDLRRIGDFYASGLDQKTIDDAGLEPLRADLARIDSLRGPADIVALIADFQRRHTAGRWGGGPSIGPFLPAMRPDPFDSSTYRVQLQQGGLGLPDRDYYLRQDERSRELVAKYRAHVARVHELLGQGAGEATASTEVVLRLETRLANASMTRVDQRDPYKVANTMPLQDFAASAAGLDWDAYLARIGAGAIDAINPRQPQFFRALAAMVPEISLNEWRTYFRWHLLRASSRFLAAPFEEAHFDFYGRTLTGQTEQKPRWERVLEVVDAGMGEALGRIYVDRVFPPQAKARMLELVNDLRAALADRIRGLEWMSAATKEQALSKLDAFNAKIGYPDVWRDYSSVRIDRASYLGNVRACGEFEFARNVAKLGRPIDRTEWGMSAPTVNAYYNPSMNEIVFPAGILRPPFFDMSADDASNYGGIGVVIGHEMSHGFDDAGSRYDAQGNLRNWWQPDDRAAYDARTDLVVKQFDAYEPLPGERINGRLTLGENIADLGGLKIAFAALKRALGRKGRPAPIDGQTPEQRFFFGHARVWRSVMRDEALRLRLRTDPHSPGRYRVNGPLSNLPEFYDAFDCSADRPMRRAEDERPSIW